MVTWVVCSIILHSNLDKKVDYKTPTQVKGYVLPDDVGDAYLMVNFYDAFKKKHVDLSINQSTQKINENDCLYLNLKTFDGQGEPTPGWYHDE